MSVVRMRLKLLLATKTSMASPLPRITLLVGLFLYFLSTHLQPVDGFAVTKPLSRCSSLTVSWARPKKRRRRKNATPPSEAEDGNELPDFDLSDGEEASEQPRKKTRPPAGDYSLESGSVSPNMMGSANTPTKSVGQLISDRSLEGKLDFDAPEDDSLPDILELSRQQDPQPTGKKRARREARVAQALQASREEEGEESLLEKLPFDLTDENGKLSPLKLLESGTWLGIYILIAWEIYINTPLFDRVAPMTPVVY